MRVKGVRKFVGRVVGKDFDHSMAKRLERPDLAFESIRKVASAGA